MVLILLGACIAGLGERVMHAEYALAIGIALLMFGLYKTTQLWSMEQYGDGEDGGKDKENNNGF